MKREINQIVILALAAAFFLGISSARAADETPVGKVQRGALSNPGVKLAGILLFSTPSNWSLRLAFRPPGALS